MSINMSNVKAITLGGQNVKKIEDANGNVLWTLPSANAAVLTFNSYMIQVRTNSRYFRIAQLTEKVASATSSTDAIKFFILTSQEIQNIQNHAYNQDTVLGHTLSEWQNSPDSYFLCYVLNNEVYMIGNSQNPTDNDTVLGTTNDLTYAKHYYPFNSGSYKYVNIVNDSSTSTDVTRWRQTNSYYWVNHTNSVGTQNTFTFPSSSSTTSPYIYYGKKALTSIAISGSYKTKIPTGSDFVFGGTVRAYYTDGTSAIVTSSATFSGYNMSTAGTYTVMVSYRENGITRTETYSLQVANASTATFTFIVHSTLGPSSSYYTLTQYFNRIQVPSKNQIISYMSTYHSKEVYSVDQVKIRGLYWCRQGVDTTYQYKPYLMNGSTTSSTIIAEGYQRTIPSSYYMDFGSVYGTEYDITDYIYQSSTKAIYGAYGRSTGTVSSPTHMFSSSTGTSTVHFSTSSVTTLPSYTLVLTYTYFS